MTSQAPTLRLEFQAKQYQALTLPATEILYGGAAGGGKSWMMRSAAILWCQYVPGLQVYLFRRKFPDLHKNHWVGPQSLPAMVAGLVLSGNARIQSSALRIDFANGSKIHLCHCQHEKDLLNYQGAEIHVLMIDELTHFSQAQYAYLRNRVRMAGLKVGAQCPFAFPRILLGSNPGGAGHNWVKAAFIDPAPPLECWKTQPEEGGMVRAYVPAKYQDNAALMREDPGYPDRIRGLGNPELVRAMLEGDWNIVAGGMFDDVWDARRIVVPPRALPSGWRRSRSFDWGSSRPFAVLWFAQANGEACADGWCPPRGSLIVAAEWYGWNGKPNEGCRMLASEVARGIIERERAMGSGWPGCKGPADSAIWATQNGNCIADDMAGVGVRWDKADKGPGSRVNGWEQVRQHLKQAGTELPGLYIFETCRHLIRTVPTLPRDPLKDDDVDSDAEDHLADALRYRVAMPARTAGSVSLPGH